MCAHAAQSACERDGCAGTLLILPTRMSRESYTAPASPGDVPERRKRKRRTSSTLGTHTRGGGSALRLEGQRTCGGSRLAAHGDRCAGEGATELGLAPGRREPGALGAPHGGGEQGLRRRQRPHTMHAGQAHARAEGRKLTGIIHVIVIWAGP